MNGYRSFTIPTEEITSGQVLDSPREADFASVTGYELAEIIVALRLDAKKMATFDVLAADLSRLAGRVEKPGQKRTEMPWTKKYVHSVYHSHIRPSPEFTSAVSKLAQTVDGTPAGMAGTAYVKVLADPARIPEGTLIPASAVVVKCARPGCPIKFVKTNHFQKYHDPECRKKRLLNEEAQK